MTLSRDEAAKALGEIEAAGGRVRSLTAYAYTAPYLILWGVGWMVADVCTALWGATPIGVWIWPAVALGFTAINVVMSLTQGTGAMPGDGVVRNGLARWKPFATAMAGALFLVALLFVAAPLNGKQVHSVFGLFFGAVYVVMGLWMGWRLLVTGVAVFALTLVAFYALPLGAGYLLFMGVIVGGGLLLGGLWLRKV